MAAAIARTDEAVRRLLNATPTPLDLLRGTAGRRPDHAALLFVRDASNPDPQGLTYVQLLEKVERVAAAFAGLGIDAEDAVALLLPSVPDTAIALIAATAVGVAFPMNPLLSADAIRAQLILARAKAVVTVGDHTVLDVRARVADAADGAGIPIVELPIGTPRPGAMRWEELLETQPRPLPPPDPDRVAALFHTGGTTGDPKLAQLTARNVAAGALMAASGAAWRDEDRLLCALPLFHVGGSIDVLLSGLAAGGTIVFPGLFGMRDPAVASNIWSIVERTKATILGAVPTSLAAIQNVPVGDAD
ncbi:MAG: AMP-binding protein, partial [Pseudomonadota bacterium]|nr:AMP-binding protein [Pseudomonadota bacterium]